jgi:hypothetical protein
MADEALADTSPENLAFHARPWLVRLGEDYKRGVDEARQVALLPEVALTIAVDREAASAAGALDEFLGQRTNAPGSKKLATGIHGLLKDKPEVRAEKERIAKARLADLENVPRIRSQLLWIRQAALVRAWASLEAFMGDAWTQTLDHAGTALRQGAFTAVARSRDLGDAPSFGDMQVKLGLLARHDFNLQNKIGTVLAEKCSFKTVDGITRAYKAAFGWKKGLSTPAFSKPDDLRRVEWKRHAIVHRGGAIDSEYAQKASLDASLVGEPLALTAEAVVDDINVIAVQGGTLFKLLLLWLEEVEPAVGKVPSS